MKSGLYRVRQRCERKILHLDRRHYHRPAVFSSCESDRRPDRLEIVEHEQWRLVEPEILERLGDLSVLDEERSVTREPGIENRARIDLAEVPQPRHEHSALRRANHL